MAGPDIDGKLDIDGKVAVVTGGASGIGLATVQRLAKEGARIVVVDRNDDAGAQTASEVGGVFVQADVSDPTAWQRVAAAAVELGGPHLAYLNAGVTTQQNDITAFTDDQYRRIMGANVDGVIFGTRALVPPMAANGGGAIVATASLAGLIAFAPDPIYTATKHAVVGFVRSIAAQLEAKGIRVNAVCPGIVDTPLVGAARERLKEAGFPMIDPDDIAGAVVACMTGEHDTGACIVCQPGRDPVPYVFHDVPGPGGAAAHRRPPG
jgi:NAD(P)-dependent dehydrogenase (short-subunit alcohol dehydrogenase family)